MEAFDLRSNKLLNCVMSGPISNTDAKQYGALQLYDVNPRKCCVRGGRKVMVISKFPLDKEVKPELQLWRNGERLVGDTEALRQPTDADVVFPTPTTVVFLSPAQSELGDGEVRLVLVRGKDGQESNSYPFHYEQCGAVIGGNREEPLGCCFCQGYSAITMLIGKKQLIQQAFAAVIRTDCLADCLPVQPGHTGQLWARHAGAARPQGKPGQQAEDAKQGAGEQEAAAHQH